MPSVGTRKIGQTAISDYLPPGEIKFKISHLSIHATLIFTDAEMKIDSNRIARIFQNMSVMRRTHPFVDISVVSQVMVRCSHNDFECITTGYPLRVCDEDYVGYCQRVVTKRTFCSN